SQERRGVGVREGGGVRGVVSALCESLGLRVSQATSAARKARARRAKSQVASVCSSGTLARVTETFAVPEVSRGRSRRSLSAKEGGFAGTSALPWRLPSKLGR